MLITSTSNERIKQARQVRDGNTPGRIFVEGERLAEECLRSGLDILSCLHTPKPSPRAQVLIEDLLARGIPCYVAEDRVLTSLSDTVTPQGIILLAKRPNFSLEQALSAKVQVPLLLGLDRVQDPGNLGTLVRTAEAAGANGLVATMGCADAFSPKTLRSAMGSAFRLPLVTGTSTADILTMCRKLGITCVAAAGTGETCYYDYDWRQPTLLWLGNEARGVDAGLLEACDVRLHIPMQAGVESLNVASAGAAMLFEAARQRR